MKHAMKWVVDRRIPLEIAFLIRISVGQARVRCSWTFATMPRFYLDRTERLQIAFLAKEHPLRIRYPDICLVCYVCTNCQSLALSAMHTLAWNKFCNCLSISEPPERVRWVIICDRCDRVALRVLQLCYGTPFRPSSRSLEAQIPRSYLPTDLSRFHARFGFWSATPAITPCRTLQSQG